MISSLNITSTTLYNGKYAYDLGGGNGYVYWNSTLLIWEHRSALGSGTLYNYLNNSGSTPIPSLTQPWVNVVPDKEILGCFIGDCPEDLCFYGTWNLEKCLADNYTVDQNCSTFEYAYSIGNTLNGKLYYIIDSPQAPFSPFYIWFNTSLNRWFFGPDLNNVSTAYSYLEDSSDPSKPIGNWQLQVGDMAPSIPYTSFVECTSTLCLNYSQGDKDELITFTEVYYPAGTHNGKPKYTSFPFFDYVIYWNIATNRWELSDVVNDSTPFAHLSYNGNLPLSGQAPTNAQWTSISSPENPFEIINYTSIGEIESDEYGPHGPCYLPICFEVGGAEAISGNYLCTTQPSGVYNGKPYYLLLNDDCITPFLYQDTNIYIYWNESQSKWLTVFGDLGSTDVIQSELSSSSDDTYPVGTWTTILDDEKVFIIAASGIECPAQKICFTYEVEALVASQTIESTGYFNGKFVYENVVIQDFGEIDIVWSSVGNVWQLYRNDVLIYTLDSSFSVPVVFIDDWVCVANEETCLNISSIFTSFGECAIPPICVALTNEALGGEFINTTMTFQGLYNGKNWYSGIIPGQVTYDDGMVYYNGTQWVFQQTTNPLPPPGNPAFNTSISSNPGTGLTPLSSSGWTLTGDGPPGQNRLLLEGDNAILNGECPAPPQQICFSVDLESEGTLNCVLVSSGYYNGKPYYEVDESCIGTPFTDGRKMWVYWDGEKWISVAALGNNPSSFTNITILSELIDSIDPSYPVGGWSSDGSILVLFSSVYVETGPGACTTPNLCICYGAESGGGCNDFSILGNTPYQNGRPVYFINTYLTVRYDGAQWVRDDSYNQQITPIPGSAGLLFPPEWTNPNTECVITSGFLCSISYEECPTTTTTSTSTSTSTSTTTSTTTEAPITAVIEITGVISPVGSDTISVRAEVISGTTADLLDFDVELYMYSDAGCTNNMSLVLGPCTHSSSLIIPSGVSTGFGWNATTNCSYPGVVSVKAASITVNGTQFIATSPQTITVGSNNYQIVGFIVCTLL